MPKNGNLPPNQGALLFQEAPAFQVPVAQVFTVPTRQKWTIRALSFTISTDPANPAARRVFVRFTANGQTLTFHAGATQGPATTRTYYFAPQIRDSAAFIGNTLAIPAPTDYYLPPGATIEIDSTPAPANDTLDSCTLQIEAWING